MLVLAFALLSALVRPGLGRAGDRLAPADSIHLATDTSSSARRHPRLRSLFGHRRRHQVRISRHLAAAMRERVVFRRNVIRYAKHFLGTPYVYGGSSPRSGFDCSGLVRYVFERFGVSLPHSSWGDMARGRRVARNHLLPGDIVFFDGGGHVGIYVGNGRFIHAPHSGTVVRIDTMAGWYSSRYDGARRLR